MTDSRFLTHEIGSLAKPPWLVKTAQGRELDETDIEHARTWGERVTKSSSKSSLLADSAKPNPRKSSPAGQAGTA